MCVFSSSSLSPCNFFWLWCLHRNSLSIWLGTLLNGWCTHFSSGWDSLLSVGCRMLVLWLSSPWVSRSLSPYENLLQCWTVSLVLMMYHQKESSLFLSLLTFLNLRILGGSLSWAQIPFCCQIAYILPTHTITHCPSIVNHNLQNAPSVSN